VLSLNLKIQLSYQNRANGLTHVNEQRNTISGKFKYMNIKSKDIKE